MEIRYDDYFRKFENFFVIRIIYENKLFERDFYWYLKSDIIEEIKIVYGGDFYW